MLLGEYAVGLLAAVRLCRTVTAACSRVSLVSRWLTIVRWALSRLAMRR